MRASVVVSAQPKLFSDFWNQTTSLLAGLGGERLPIEANHHTRVCTDSSTRLSAEAWEMRQQSLAIAEARVVYITSRNAEIANLVVFSQIPSLIPGLMIEVVALGNRPRLAFMDFPSPGMGHSQRAKVAESLEPLRRRYTQLPRQADVPAWAVRFSPGNFLFSRVIQESLPPEIFYRAFFDYLGEWVHFTSTQAIVSTGISSKVAQEIESYKQEHLEHSPGIPFLEKFFGKAWTHDFMHNFLYR